MQQGAGTLGSSRVQNIRAASATQTLGSSELTCSSTNTEQQKEPILLTTLKSKHPTRSAQRSKSNEVCHSSFLSSNAAHLIVLFKHCACTS